MTAFPREDEFAAMQALRADGAERGAASLPILGYEAWWDLPALPKLNLDDPQVRSFILDVAEHWIRFGADGWRLDVAEEIKPDFWREFRQRVRAADPEAYLVAEIWDTRPDWLRGDMFDAFMNYPLLEAVVGFVAGGHIDRTLVLPEEWQGGLRPLDAASFWSRIVELESLHEPGVDGVQLNLLGSHDTPRLRTLCGGDRASVRLATLIQMTLPGAPCIYQGDEIGMEGLMDPDCRRAFPADQDEWTNEPYAWLADLIALRRSSRVMRHGSVLLLGARAGALAYLRESEGEAFAVIVNTDNDPVRWQLELPFVADSAEPLPLDRESTRTAEAPQIVAEGSLLEVRLPARSGAVVCLAFGAWASKGTELASEPILER